jgi:hypothetical protein
MRSVRQLLFILGFMAMGVAGVASPASAQGADINPNISDSPADDDSVIGRSRPEYDAQGLPLGAFRIYPVLNATASYDDNVLRTNTSGQSDSFVEIGSQLSLRSQWSRHYLGLSAAVMRSQYSKLSSENKTTWQVAGNGRVDVVTGVGFSAAAQHASTFELRTSRDQIGAAEPTPYQRSDARFEFSYDPYRIGLQLGAEFERYHYDSTILLASSGGGVRNNNDRDRNVYSVHATALYEFSPGYAAFIRPTYEKRVYDLQIGRAAGRDSQGYRMDTGINLLLSRLVVGEAYVGYISEDLKGPGFADLSGIDYGAALRWYPSELITVHLNASRTPNATTIAGASLADDRYVEAGVDYELLRNVIVQADVAYTDTKLDGITRRDQDLSAQLGVRYLLNSTFRADARFTHTARASTEAGRGYTDNVFSITLSARL